MKDFRYGLGLSAAVLAGVLSAVSAPAAAQSMTAGTTGTLSIAQSNPALSPIAAPSLAPAAEPTSPFPGLTALGQTLKNDGIYLSLSFLYDMNSLVSGGLKTGTVPNDELAIGTVLDLQTILGIPEASFHILFDQRGGFGLNSNVGTGSNIEQDLGPTRATRLSQFYWEQGFYNDRIDIQVGRTNPTPNFATGDLSCEFISGVFCGQPSSWYASNSNQSNPASTWGGFLNVQATPAVYFRTGVYDDDPTQALPNQEGFNWNVRGSTGVFIPMELGYQTSFDNARYPAKYNVGGYWDDADYTTPEGVPMRGRTAVYMQFEQTVWRPNLATHQSLSVFGGAFTYSGGAAYWGEYYAGIFDRAPFASRPDDTIGLVGSYYANNSDERPNQAGEWIFELNYGIHVAPGVTFKPYTQYVVAPTNFLAPVGTKEPGNAWVVGFQFTIDVGKFLGFPHFTAY